MTFPKTLYLLCLAIFSALCCAAQTSITKIEYYVDTDPGYGNGISIPVTPGSDNLSTRFTVDFTSLSAGVHIVSVRTKDADGKWSLDNQFQFTKLSIPLTEPAVPALSRSEYYVDIDPGYGNGVPVSISPGPQNGTGSVVIDISSLSLGAHTVVVRTKDAGGKWSLDNSFAFNKSGPIGKKYYLDADGDSYGTKLRDSTANSQPDGFVLDSTDCNDGDYNIHPHATELCDGIDNDCDGVVDNGFVTRAVKGNPAVCIGTTLSLKATGGNTYQWTGPKGFIIGSTDSIAIGNMQLADSGSYTVIITGNCKPDTIVTQVFVVSAPKATITGLNGSYCLNDPPAVLTGLPSGGVFSGAAITGNSFTPGTVGNSTVYYISPAYYGCPSDTAKLSTTVYGLPTVIISSSGNNVLCKGDSVILTANTTAGNFLWSNGSTSKKIIINRPDTFSVTVTDANGCSKSSGITTIALDSTLHIIANPGNIICSGDPVELSFNASSVVWTPGGTGTKITVSPTATVFYKVQGQSANNCLNTDSIKITVNPSAIPGAVTNMFPANGSSDLHIPVVISWFPGQYNTRYIIHVWKNTQQESEAVSLPTNDISIELYQLDLDTQYSWRVISFNGNCGSTVGPVQTFTARSLPDLAVQNISAPTNVVGGQQMSISWEVINLSTGSTGSRNWIDKVYVSPVDNVLQQNDILVASHLNFSVLASRQSYSDSATISIPLKAAGKYYVIIQADDNGNVPESNESNNTSASKDSINIDIPPTPDLKVTSVASQDFVYSGSGIIVNYTIINDGTISASAPRVDKIYITQRSILDTAGVKLAGSFRDTLPLPRGQSRTISAIADVPRYIYGTYFVHVIVDGKDEVYEGTKEDNNTNSQTINIILSPTPDLIVSGLEINDKLNAGDQLRVIDLIKNDGKARTDRPWFDGIFLSRDTVLNLSTAIPIGWVYFTNNKPLSDSIPIYTHSDSDSVIYLRKCPVGAHNCRYEYFFSAPAVIRNFESGLFNHPHTFYLDANEVAIIQNYIDPGKTELDTFNIKLPDTLSGTYNVFVVTDVTNSIFEFDKENNNILRRGNNTSNSTAGNQPVTIVNPDLTVSNVITSGKASAGSNQTVSWTAANKGPGNLKEINRTDGIYLSKSPTSLANAILLADYPHALPLKAGETTQSQKTITLPVDISDIWYVIVVADRNNNVFEAVGEGNNFGASAALQINITEWADIVPSSITIPDTLKTTLVYNLSTLVTNKGTLYANGDWTDAAYISTSPVWDSASAILLNTYNRSEYVEVNASYNSTDKISLPLTAQLNGPDSSIYYIYYKANIGNRLFENTAPANNILRSGPVFVYNPAVDHIVTYVAGPDTARSGNIYQTKWTVENIGERAGSPYYSEWFDGLYRSTDTLFDTGDTLLAITPLSIPLDHKASYNKTINYVIPGGIMGDYYLIEKTDAKDQISAERIKSNNHNLIRDNRGAPKLIHFISSPPSDLEIVEFIAPQTGRPGQPINIQYTVKNNGPGKADLTSWFDQLSLSRGYSPGQILWYSRYTKSLDADSSYTGNFQAMIPNDALGNYVLVLQTDANNFVYEPGAKNNNTSYAVISISQLPPSDLIAANIIVPDSVLSGARVTISWNLINTSLNPAAGYTREAVYLSKDTQLDNQDQLLGIIDDSISINGGSFIAHRLSVNVNSNFEGYGHVLVRVDLLNNINESNENNNVTVANDSIYLAIKKLSIGEVTNDSLSNTNLLNYKIEISSALQGQTLEVSVTGDTLHGNSELYLSAGKIPSLSTYDLADNNPYHTIKQVVIPSLDSGAYYITLKGTVANGAGQPVQLFAHILPFAITKVETNHGGNSGNVTIKITGSKFEPGMVAILKPVSAGANINAVNTTYINSTSAWATFNLNQQSLGVYSVVLHKTNNTEAILSGGFTIETVNNGNLTIVDPGAGGSPNAPGCRPGAGRGTDAGLQLVINSPFQERTGSNIPITILFQNAGNVDIPIPTRLLVSDLFPVSFQNYFPNYEQKELMIEFKEAGGPPGILRAGASGAVIFYTRIIRPVQNNYFLQ